MSSVDYLYHPPTNKHLNDYYFKPMYYQETKLADERVTLDDLTYFGDGTDLFNKSKGHFDKVSIWRSEFEFNDHHQMKALEDQIDNFVARLGLPYEHPTHEGGMFEFTPRHNIIKRGSLYTYGLDAPRISGADEHEHLFHRRCRIKGWLKHRRDGLVNLALDYVDFYPDDYEKPVFIPYVPVPGEIEF